MAIARTPHGHLTSIWMRLAQETRRNCPSRAKLDVYVGSRMFLDAFNALDGARRVLALLAVTRAYQRLDPTHAKPEFRVKWTTERKARLIALAPKTADDQTLADMLGLPKPATMLMRWRLCGRRRVPHITARGPAEIVPVQKAAWESRQRPGRSGATS